MNKKVLMLLGVFSLLLLSSNSSNAAYICNGKYTKDPCLNSRNTGMYSVCVNSSEYKNFKKLERSGKCERTVTKFKSFGSCRATAIVGVKSNKGVKYSSNGGNCVSQMKKIYPPY